MAGAAQARGRRVAPPNPPAPPQRAGAGGRVSFLGSVAS